MDPWLGAGIGYEWLTVGASSTTDSSSVSNTFNGWNLADALFGVDFRVAPSFAFGPFIELTSGSFGSMDQTLTPASGATRSRSSDFANPSSHQWMAIGFRGSFDFGADDLPDAR